jgi:hypothetical protein
MLESKYTNPLDGVLFKLEDLDKAPGQVITWKPEGKFSGDVQGISTIDGKQTYVLEGAGGASYAYANVDANVMTSITPRKSNPFQKFMQDVAPFVLPIIAITNPALIGVIGSSITGAAAASLTATIAGTVAVTATLTAATGGDLEDIVKNSLVAAVTVGVGGSVSSSVAESVTASTGSTTAGKIVGSTVGAATSAAATGGDIESAIANSLLNSAVNLVKDEVLLPRQEPAPVEVRDIATAPTTTENVISPVQDSDLLDLITQATDEIVNAPTQQTVDIAAGTPTTIADIPTDLSEEEILDAIAALEEPSADQIGGGTIGEPISTVPTEPQEEEIVAVQQPGGGEDLTDAEIIDYLGLDRDAAIELGLAPPEEEVIELGGGEGEGEPPPMGEEDIVSVEDLPEEEAIFQDYEPETAPGGTLDEDIVSAEDLPEGEVIAEEDQLGEFPATTTDERFKISIPRLPSRTVQDGNVQTRGSSYQDRNVQTISPKVTGEALASILGEKEPLFGGDEDEQRAVWNRRSLRLRRALGL